MKKKFFILLSLILLLLTSCGYDKSYPGVSTGKPPADTTEVMSFHPEQYGYIIFDPEKDITIKAHNTFEAFIPASISKIFTTVFALEILGTGYNFSTDLLYTGDISNGVIKGNLILRGGGDPELAVHELLEMIYKIKETGIKSITGKFYYDIALFDSKEILDEGMPVNARYNQGYGPLNLNHNIICAIKKRDDDGRLSSCFLVPSVPSNSSFLYDGPAVFLYAKYIKQVGIETWGLPSSGIWENGLQLPVKNSGLFTSQAFRKLCSIHGIELPVPEKCDNSSHARVLVSHKSRKLFSIIKDMLVSSDNLTAELLGNIALQELKKSAKDHPNSIENFFRHAFPSVRWDNFKLNSFSGLSDNNRATPEQTAAMLIHLSRIDVNEIRLSNLLPLSGIEGTMRTRLDYPETAFRISAKTGTIYYASALAGEFTANSGKNYFFAVYINDLDKRREYSGSGNGSLDKAKNAEKWSSSAVKSIDDFICTQIKKL